MSSPAETTLELKPSERFDLIEVSRRVGDFLEGYERALYCSYHTTAGYLEKSLCARLNHSADSLRALLQGFQSLFPPNARYQHDQIHLRDELSAEQKRTEPRNADSHLTFIGFGLNNCVTYSNPAETPIYFIDLDGVNGEISRTRRTSVIGFNKEVLVDRRPLSVPVSTHAVDAVNLRDPRLGILEELTEALRQLEIEKGRIDISLGAEEQHSGLTINEYETLLMKHDLAEVLSNPLRFMAQKGRSILRNPKAIPNKTVNYAKYDLVQVINGAVDVLGLSDSAVERLIDKFLTVTASRFLRMRRSVNLPVCDVDIEGEGSILQGTYQSPILAQWNKADGCRRELSATFYRFE